MRKVIVTNIVTPDGYFEGPGKDFLAMPEEDAFDEYNAERLRAADTLVLGRLTYEGANAYWPGVADDSTAPAGLREMSRLINAMDKVVVSDSLTPERTAPWHDTRIVRRGAAHEAVAGLRRSPGRDILIFGSHVLWNDLLAHGLVDELHLMIGPKVLGGGTPAFELPAPVSLRLLDARPLPYSQLVLIRYGVASSARPMGAG
ncbi:dihydrofolate reductase family protein [Nonomuraea sp. NPDC050547]|uniref:dihydrofolate reductase family protein n=1 Tax=Nonomuraea sp. NPDC050547 TaxID=3364368 RepID=UPI003797B5BF